MLSQDNNFQNVTPAQYYKVPFNLSEIIGE